MPVFDNYAQGTPNWVELMTPDQRAAAEFYGDLFGWQMVENPLDDGRVYIIGNLQGDAVAGIAAQLPEMAEHPAFWNVYLAADDVDAVAALVGPAGGEVEAEPFDFFDLGRTARIKDPTGARVNLWHGNRHFGTRRANEPGTPIWNELLTPDIGRAAQFYSDVFGMSAEESAVAWGSTGSYTTLSCGRPAGSPPPSRRSRGPRRTGTSTSTSWTSTTPSAVAEALGAKLITPPYDLEGTGRMAALTDPHGAMFCLMAS